MAIMPDLQKITVDDLTPFFPNTRGVSIKMLRLDKVHEIISGNKWFKLKYNLEAALKSGHPQVITFGGAFSNHLIATAAAAANAGLQAVGIVRGLHAKENYTQTLKACEAYGMKLHFVSRQAYSQKRDNHYLAELINFFGKSFIIPEGGDNEEGCNGASEIVPFIPEHTTTVCLPVGTGATFTGIRNGLPLHQKMIGFPAIKDGAYLKEEISLKLSLPSPRHWELNTDWSFGGFAKSTPELRSFLQSFYTKTLIQLDLVYTGKMMAGVAFMLQHDKFAEEEQVLCIHTGGLQGNPVGLF